MSETIPADVMAQARDDFARFISPSPTAFDAFNTSLIVHGLARAILSERDRATAVTEAQVEAACRGYWPLHWPQQMAEADKVSIRQHMRAALEAAAAIRNPMEGRG